VIEVWREIPKGMKKEKLNGLWMEFGKQLWPATGKVKQILPDDGKSRFKTWLDMRMMTL
jgi:hypothetical protein